MALSFIFWFSVFTFVRYKISGSSNMMFFYLPMTGPVFYLFSFFHITDPITSPSTRKGRLLFAFILAVIDGILRYNQVLYSPFYALFIATILKQFLPQILPLQDSKKIWIYKQFLIHLNVFYEKIEYMSSIDGLFFAIYWNLSSKLLF